MCGGGGGWWCWCEGVGCGGKACGCGGVRVCESGVLWWRWVVVLEGHKGGAAVGRWNVEVEGACGEGGGGNKVLVTRVGGSGRSSKSSTVGRKSTHCSCGPPSAPAPTVRRRQAGRRVGSIE